MQIEHQRWVEDLGDSRAWWQGVAPSKIADFAGEAAAADAAVMGDYGPAKRIALVAALVFTAQAKARDDTAEMFCRRVGTLAKRARAELEELKDQHREVTERLIGTYRTVLEHLDPDGEAAAREQAAARRWPQGGGGRGRVRRPAGATSRRCRAYHGDNYVLLVARHFRKDRAVMFAHGRQAGAWWPPAPIAACWTPLEHARELRTVLTRDHIPDHVPLCDEDGAGCWSGRQASGEFRTSFASGNWRRAVSDRTPPGHVGPPALRGVVFTYLAEELRTGDIAVTGAGEYADWAANLLPWEECEPLLGGLLRRGRPARHRGAGSPSGSGTPTWTRPARWTPATRTTPTW